jgi:hypothetical protein
MKLNKNFVYILIGLLLTVDLAYSFWQYQHTPLYGDLSEIVLTSNDYGYHKMLHDPIGFKVLVNHEKYAGPNRFFAHWTTILYFQQVPKFLQNFVSPIDSVYLSAAIAKTAIHILILYLLAVFVSGSKQVFSRSFLTASLLLEPLFQTAGYVRYIGLIDPSVLYTFFYALPIALLMLFFLPFYNSNGKDLTRKIHPVIKALLLVLMIVTVFNGPLIPAIVLVFCPLCLFYLGFEKFSLRNELPYGKRLITAVKSIPSSVLIYFVCFSLLSLYSLYIGRNNTMNFAGQITLLERYKRLPEGIFILMTNKIALTLLFSGIIVNYIIIRKHDPSPERAKISGIIKIITLFSVIYILLLPFRRLSAVQTLCGQI